MSAKNQSEQVLKIQQNIFVLSRKRTAMAATRTYLSAERTLSVWIRTSLSAMVFGIAIDRFGFMFGHTEKYSTILGLTAAPTTIIGVILVFFSALMALSAGIRFVKYTNNYKASHQLPHNHSGWLPVIYAAMVVIFGTGLLLLMWIAA